MSRLEAHSDTPTTERGPAERIRWFTLARLNQAAKELAVFVLERRDPSKEEIRAAVEPVSHRLCAISRQITELEGLDIKFLYAERIAGMEQGKTGGLYMNTFYESNPGQPPPSEMMADGDWAQLQQAQALLDEFLSPDIIGMEPIKQLEHHCLHLAKLAGRATETQTDEAWQEFCQKYLADTFAFGVILANLAGLALTEDGVRQYEELSRGLITCFHPAEGVNYATDRRKNLQSTQ